MTQRHEIRRLDARARQWSERVRHLSRTLAGLGSLPLWLWIAFALACSGGSCSGCSAPGAPGDSDGTLDEGTAGDDAEGDAPAGSGSIAIQVRGEVLLAVELPELPGGNAKDPEGPPVLPAGDPRFVPAAGLPADVLVPAEAKPAPEKSCRLRLIQAGVILASTRKECDATGRYNWVAQLQESSFDRNSPLALEIEIATHLRALLLVEVEPLEAARGADDSAQGDATGGDTDKPAADGVQATWQIAAPTVVLGHAASVLGQVTDARGRPIPNIEVQAMPVPDLDEPEPWRTTTDVHGQFLFDTLPPGPVSVRSVAQDHALTVVEAVAPERDLVLQMTGLIDLEGKAYGKPADLQAALVRVEGSGLWPALEQPLGPDGDFQIEALPDGIYGLEVVVSRVSGRELASLPLEGVTPDLKIDLALLPAFRVPVEVRDESGLPIVGARVTGGYASVGMLARSAVSDASGHVELGPFVPGPYVIRAEADGYLPGTPADVEVAARGEGDRHGADPVVFVLLRAASIEGEVVDEDGVAVAGAEIELIGDGLTMPGSDSVSADLFARGLEGSRLVSSGSLGVTTGSVPSIPRLGEWVLGEGEEDASSTYLSDDVGGFRMEMLMPGRYQLRACDGDHRCSITEVVVLKSGAVIRDRRLVLRRGTWVRGQVLDDNGQPIDGARVELEDGDLWLDERGAFDAGQRRGTLRIVARAPGYEAQAVSLALPKEVRGNVPPRDVSIALVPAQARLSMVIRDENGQAIEKARVSISWKSGLEPSKELETDRKGALVLEGLARGPIRIEVEHPDFSSGEATWILREPGKDSELALTLSRGGTVEVELRADDGDPIANATVSVGNMVAFTDARGHAQLLHVAPGSETLRVTAQQMAPLTRRVTVESEGRLELSLEMVRAGGLVGRIDDERGEAVAGAVITVRDASGAEQVATTNARGAFELDGLAPGACVLVAQPPADLDQILEVLEVDCTVVASELGPELALRFDRRAP